MIFGNGIKDDIDTAINFNKSDCKSISILSTASQSEVTNDEEKIINFLQSRQERDDDEDEPIQIEEEEINQADGDYRFDSSSSSKDSPSRKTTLDSVKETDEEHQSEEQQKKKEIFGKHRINKIHGYVNFNQKLENFHDLGEYSWDINGNDLFSRFLPDLTEAMHSQLTYAFNMTKNTYG